MVLRSWVMIAQLERSSSVSTMRSADCANQVLKAFCSERIVERVRVLLEVADTGCFGIDMQETCPD